MMRRIPVAILLVGSLPSRRAIHLPFEPRDFLFESSFADPSPALPNIQPHELCLITDHEPVARNMCETLFKDVEATLHRSGEREGALEEATSTVEGFKSVGARLWDDWSRHYNKIIPCINREYACRHGYSFFMPSSPWLTILQPGVSPTNGDKQADELMVANAETACTELHATAHKTDVHMEDTVRRSNTWCKIAVLGMLARDFPGCKALAFIDADLLLLPANNRTYTYGQQFNGGPLAKSMVQQALLTDKGLQITADRLFETKRSPAWVNGKLLEILLERESTAHAIGGERELLQRRLPLHRQHDVREFLAAPGAAVLTNLAAGGGKKTKKKKEEEEEEEEEGKKKQQTTIEEALSMMKKKMRKPASSSSRVNSKMSSSLMVLKNSPRLRLILHEWWHSVDHSVVTRATLARNATSRTAEVQIERAPNKRRTASGTLLESYRTLWPHEQIAFDDFLALKFKGELFSVDSPKIYNNAGGRNAHHYFNKEVHRWSYVSFFSLNQSLFSMNE